MRAPWTPGTHSHASLDPLRGGHWDPDGYIEDGRVSRALGLNYRQGSAPGFAAWRYVRPHGPLLHEVEVPGCGSNRRVRIPTAAGNASFVPGQMVSVGTLVSGAVILGRPPGGLLGQSAFALEDFDAGAFDDLVIHSVAPQAVEAGAVDVELTITGWGFRESPLDTIMAAVYLGDEDDPDFGEYEADPYVTLHDLAWVNAQSVTVLADALSTTPDGYRVGFAWRRGG